MKTNVKTYSPIDEERRDKKYNGFDNKNVFYKMPEAVVTAAIWSQLKSCLQYPGYRRAGDIWFVWGGKGGGGGGIALFTLTSSRNTKLDQTLFSLSCRNLDLSLQTDFLRDSVMSQETRLSDWHMELGRGTKMRQVLFTSKKKSALENDAQQLLTPGWQRRLHDSGCVLSTVLSSLRGEVRSQ